MVDIYKVAAILPIVSSYREVLPLRGPRDLESVAGRLGLELVRGREQVAMGHGVGNLAKNAIDRLPRVGDALFEGATSAAHYEVHATGDGE
jgi:hypothetical protein